MRRTRNRRKAYATNGWNALALPLCVVLGFPIYWMLITAFKTSKSINQVVPQFWPHPFTLSGFSGVLGDPIFRRNLLNSLIITLAAVLVSIVIGFLGAVAIARFRFAGRRVFVFTVLIVQMIPLLALTIPMSLLLDKFHLKNTLTGVAIAYLMFTMPYTIWTLRTFIANIPHRAGRGRAGRRLQSLADVLQDHPAARGARPHRHRRLRLDPRLERVRARQHPAADNSKQTTMIYLLVFQSSPTHGADYGGLMAAATLTALPVVFLFVVFQSRISAGLTSGAVKG